MLVGNSVAGVGSSTPMIFVCHDNVTPVREVRVLHGP
jgi:hypothetical protein